MDLQHLYDNTMLVGTFDTFKRALEVAADSHQAFNYVVLEHLSIDFKSPLDRERHHELIVAPKAIEACAHAEMIGTVYCLNDETVNEIICEIVSERERQTPSTHFGDAVTAGLFNAVIKTAADSKEEYDKAADEIYGSKYDWNKEGCTFSEALEKYVHPKETKADKDVKLIAKMFHKSFEQINNYVWREVGKRQSARDL